MRGGAARRGGSTNRPSPGGSSSRPMVARPVRYGPVRQKKTFLINAFTRFPYFDTLLYSLLSTTILDGHYKLGKEGSSGRSAGRQACGEMPKPSWPARRQVRRDCFLRVPLTVGPNQSVGPWTLAHAEGSGAIMCRGACARPRTSEALTLGQGRAHATSVAM